MKFRDILARPIREQTLDSEAFPLMPIVELAGCSRLLVESHQGVIQYSETQIGIKMRYGLLTVCGCRLTLEHMTKGKLIITGQIDSVTLTRRCEK